MDDLVLPGFQKLPSVGDALGRRYTPDKLALQIVKRLALQMPEPKIAVESAVGGASFVRAIRKVWPNTKVIGVDLDEEAPGLSACDLRAVGDWTVLAPGVIQEYRPELVVSNPPFDDPRGGAPTRAQDFTRATFVKGSEHRTAYILPLGYLGTQAWERLLLEHPLRHLTPIVGRPWPEHVRETTLFTWAPGSGPATLEPAIGDW